MLALGMESLRTSPDNAQLQHRVGLAFYGKGDYNRAISFFSTALSLDPEYLEACYYRSLAFQKLGQLIPAGIDTRRLIGLKEKGVKERRLALRQASLHWNTRLLQLRYQVDLPD